MADKDTVWTAVKSRYDIDGLIALTNIRDRSAVAIDDTVGTEAANGVINLWPMYAQETFDVSDNMHLEVAVRGVIAMLWERGGSSAEIAKVEWDEVFSDDGLMGRLRGTGARGRQTPSSNSGVTQKAEGTSTGARYRGWADRESLPTGYMPIRTTASDT